MSRVRVGVLISGTGSNLQALIDAAADPSFPAEIAVVISNRPGVLGLIRAQLANIPAITLPHRGFATRERYDQALVDALNSHGVSWVLLAGFLRIVTPTLLGAFPDRVLNVHPALLPAFPGLHGPAQAIAHGAQIAGCTIHFVDSGTDTGPIVLQGATAVLPTDTADTLADRIIALEHQLFPRALRWLGEGRLTVRDGRAHLEGEGERFLWRAP